LSELGNLVEQTPNAPMDLDAAFAPAESVSMGEGLMDDGDEVDAETADDAEGGPEQSAAAEDDTVAVPASAQLH